MAWFTQPRLFVLIVSAVSISAVALFSAMAFFPLFSSDPSHLRGAIMYRDLWHKKGWYRAGVPVIMLPSAFVLHLLYIALKFFGRDAATYAYEKYFETEAGFVSEMVANSLRDTLCKYVLGGALSCLTGTAGLLLNQKETNENFGKGFWLCGLCCVLLGTASLASWYYPYAPAGETGEEEEETPLAEGERRDSYSGHSHRSESEEGGGWFQTKDASRGGHDEEDGSVPSRRSSRAGEDASDSESRKETGWSSWGLW